MKNKSIKTAYAVIVAAMVYMAGYYLYEVNSGKTAKYCQATEAMVKSAWKNGAISTDEMHTMRFYVMRGGLHTPAYYRMRARQVRGMLARAYARQSDRQDCEQYAKAQPIKCYVKTQLQSYKP